MKKKFIFIFLFFITHAYAELELVAESSEKNLFFIDPSKISENKNSRVFKLVSFSPESSKFNSAIETDEFNCETSEFREIEQEQYLKGNIDYLLFMYEPFAGIGIKLEKKDSQFIINSIFDNSPAQRNDLKINDEIDEINGNKVNNLAFSKVISLLRGEPGSSLELKIKRGNQIFKYLLTREYNHNLKNETHFLGTIKDIGQWKIVEKDENSIQRKVFNYVCSNTIKPLSPKNNSNIKWIYGSHSVGQEGMSTFFDINSLEIIGDIRIVNILYDFINPQKEGHLSSIYNSYQVDCLRKKSRFSDGKVIDYKLNVGKGPVVKEFENGLLSEWEPHIKGSVAELLNDEICTVKEIN